VTLGTGKKGNKYPFHLLRISSLGESVSLDPGLQLGRGLGAPLEVAFLEAPVDTDGQVVRDVTGDINNLLKADVSKSGINDIGWETEESLSDLTGTGVLVAKSGDEGERITPGVDLVMDRTLGEKGSLAWSQGVDDETSPVLFDEPCFHIALDEIKELGRSGMGVGGVHSARLHVNDSHSQAVREERGEISDIGESQVSASTRRGTDSCSEVENPVLVIRENIKTSHLGRGLLQICHEIGGLGSISGLSDGLESGSEDERDSSEEPHSWGKRKNSFVKGDEREVVRRRSEGGEVFLQH